MGGAPAAARRVPLGTQVGVALALLQAPQFGDAGGDEARFSDELVLLQAALAQRDLADLERDALQVELLDRVPELVAAAALGALGISASAQTALESIPSITYQDQ